MKDAYSDWKAFLDALNAKAPATCNKAYQTSYNWIQMMTEVPVLSIASCTSSRPLHRCHPISSENPVKIRNIPWQVAVVNGLVQSVLLAAVFALVCVMIFLGDLAVATLCTTVVLAVVTCTFGVLSWAGWTLGTVEAICITMLVGLSVDYAVHLADSYIHNGIGQGAAGAAGGPIARDKRLCNALSHIGAPVLHSALTTAGAAAVLFFCQIQLMVRVGIIICINATIGILATLFTLAALLASVAPEEFASGATMYSRGVRLMLAVWLLVGTGVGLKFIQEASCFDC